MKSRCPILPASNIGRAFALLLALALAGPVAAADAAESKGTEEKPASEAKQDGSKPAEPPVVFERVRVVGSPTKAAKQPNSATYIDRERMDQQHYTDVNRVLFQVPGMNIQEEEGYGLRPNIGIRGSGSARSSKVTIMEDGVLIAPAPYSAPSAYYFPTIARMQGVEVRKGSAAIRQGPFSTAGVVNMISTDIPSEFGGEANVAFGSNATLRGRAHVGDSSARFGWMVEGARMETDGFKQLDTGGATGFEVTDYQGKFRFTSKPTSKVFQAIEFKLGRTDQDGDETYLGLTQEDFEATPLRRYFGSQQDHFASEHEAYYARYLLRPNAKFDLTATLYRNDFYRNWRKLEQVNGVGISSVLGSPDDFTGELDILRAELAGPSADDALTVRNNRRTYFGQGLHVIGAFHPGGIDSRHDIEVGLRIHEDEEDRFQEQDGYRMNADGQMVRTSAGAPGSQSNRVSGARALSLFAQDTISWNRWTIVPGVRFETIELERTDYADAERTQVSGRRTNDVDVVIPGLSAAFAVTDASTVFGGIHRGFAPPSPSASTSGAEESVNYELGYRFGKGALRTEAVTFFTDYENLLGECTVSSGCSTGDIGDQFDGGAVESYGFEGMLAYDIGAAADLGVSVPLNVSYTYTHARFGTTFESDFDPWGDVTAGDELPYVPENQLSLGIGVVAKKFALFATTAWVAASRTVAGSGPIPIDERADERFLVDLSGRYHVTEKLEIYGEIRNLLDEIYVAARQPAGARPGLDRTLLGGVAYRF